MRAGLPRILPLAGLIVVIAAATAWIVTSFGVVTPKERTGYLVAQGVCWALFVVAIVLLKRVPARAVPALVLGGALLLGAAGATGQPTTSTDSARYDWDGIVQLSGTSPYRYVPADSRLADLRPQWLFPTGHTRANGSFGCPGDRAVPTAQVFEEGVICTAINRPQVPTIYPPVAEALFALARAGVPPTATYWPMQVLGIVVVLATTALLLAELRRTGIDPRRAALFAWCPFVTAEAVTNAHIDGAAALLALAATVLVVRGRSLAGGVVLGLAIATKVLPVLITPPLLRRRPLRLVGGAVGAIVLVYLPHVLIAGDAVIGYLPGYLQEEGYGNGTRSALISLVLPDAAGTVVAAAVLAVVAVLVLLRADPASPWVGQAVMIGAALIVTSPRYGWYALLLIPFIAMSGRWEWFGILLLLVVAQLAIDPVVFDVGLVLATLAAIGGAVARGRGGDKHRVPRSLASN